MFGGGLVAADLAFESGYVRLKWSCHFVCKLKQTTDKHFTVIVNFRSVSPRSVPSVTRLLARPYWPLIWSLGIVFLLSVNPRHLAQSFSVVLESVRLAASRFHRAIAVFQPDLHRLV